MVSALVMPAVPVPPFPTVTVVCAYEVSAQFDFNHRLAYYLSILFLLIAPVHRILTPLVSSFVVLYGLFNVVYAGGLAALSTRLGPSLDIYPLHAILLVSTYAFATLIFCRTNAIKGKRAWGAVMRWFFIMWAGFVLANTGKDLFEKRTAKSMMAEVECRPLAGTHCGERHFFVNNALACRNPCSAPKTGDITLPGQALLKPVVWGTVYNVGATMKFAPRARPDLAWSEMAIIVLFGIALSLTLWLNFFTNPRLTRNTVFSLFGRRGASAIRNSVAKMVAFTWFAWSYLALLLVALALPAVVGVQEVLLRAYPVSRSCNMRAWLPWIVGMALCTALYAGVRKRVARFWQQRQRRVEKMQAALADVKVRSEEPGTAAELKTAVDALLVQADKYKRFVRRCAGKVEEHCKIADGIVEPRKVDGFRDALQELHEWWADPLGEMQYQQLDAKIPAADEEKALLAERYADEERRSSVDEPVEKLSEMEA